MNIKIKFISENKSESIVDDKVDFQKKSPIDNEIFISFVE